MKDLIKKWWFWVVIVLVIIIVILITLVINKSGGVGTAGISLEEFEEINLGMSNSTVNKIIDKLDEWDDDNIYNKCCKEISKSSQNSVYTYSYKYYGEKRGYAIITFEADYSKGDLFVLPSVVKKENFNLK